MASQDKQAFREQLAIYALHPNRALGQNFLVNQDALEALVEEMAFEAPARVLEIGTGTGQLTAALARRAEVLEIQTIEIDEQLQDLLRARFALNPKVHLFQGDALKRLPEDWTERGLLEERAYVVGNLPYYISTQLIAQYLIHVPKALQYSFLIQKEFADRISTPVGSKAYGPLNIFLESLTERREGKVLGPGYFYPEPPVVSQMIHWKTRATASSSVQLRQAYWDFLKLCFQHRRKLLTKTYPTLQRSYPALQDLPVEAFFASAELPLQTRAEQVREEQWRRLFAHCQLGHVLLEE